MPTHFKTFTTWWSEFLAFIPDVELEASRSRIAKTLAGLIIIYGFLLGILITVSVQSPSCISGRDNNDPTTANSSCLINDWKTRDAACPDDNPASLPRYSYMKVNFLGMKLGRCYCCGKDPYVIDEAYPRDEPWRLGFGACAFVLILVAISIWCGVRVRKSGGEEEVPQETGTDLNETNSILENVIKRLSSFEPNFPFKVKTSIVSGQGVTLSNYQLLLNRAKIFHNIARSSFSYDRLGGKLGEGQFGVVYKGSLVHYGSGELVSVAIKTIRPDSGSGESMETFLNEIKVMRFVGEHQNVISLLGVCVEDIKLGNVFGILELCEKGDLKTYLQMSRIVPAIKSTVEVSSILQGYCAIVVPPENTYVKLWSDLNSSDGLFPQFIKWAREIASGMAYLGSKKVLHVDLAARNVLLDRDLTAKVGDFGLSRKLYYLDDIYNKTGKEPIPIKWVALECVTGNKYSVKSDVWSYGVLLWEIFSFGKEPFHSLSAQDFISVLVSGIRLPCPEYCSEEIFEQMSRCWSEDPDDRPSFTELEDYFGKLHANLLANYEQAKEKSE